MGHVKRWVCGAGLAVLVAAPATGAAGGGATIVRRDLRNGTRLTVVTAPGAEVQTFFAMLPLGLAHDDAGRTQWAHLLEHLLIRSHDAEGLADGAIRFNGETTESALRFDVHAPPKEAARAAAKVVAWLGADRFEPAILEREKRNIGLELDGTVAGGFTHKWASAAWAQVVRHGFDAVEVRGAVDAATVEEVAGYARAKRPCGDELHLYAVGPLTADAVAALFEEPLAKALPVRRAVATAADQGLAGLAGLAGGDGDGGERAGGAALRRGAREATWDLSRHHLIEWYVVPDATPAQRFAAVMLSQAFAQALLTDEEVRRAGILATVSADVVVPEGRIVLFSAALPDAAAVGVARAGFERARASLALNPPAGSLDRWLAQSRAELEAGLPDFGPIKRQLAGKQNADLAEAQIVLALAMREHSAGVDLPQLAAALRTLTGAKLLRLRDDHLTPALANELLLLPPY